jgi:hypothetical protein
MTLVAKSLGETAQAPVLGNRAWDHRSGSELGSEVGDGLRTVRIWVNLGVGVGVNVNATLLSAYVLARVPSEVLAKVSSSGTTSGPELTSQLRFQLRSAGSVVAPRLVANTPCIAFKKQNAYKKPRTSMKHAIVHSQTRTQ